jgi:hypothetical protein
MADHGVFIGFGFPARGREEGAVKVFQELLVFLGGQAQQGNVESFEPVFVAPHGGELGGFVLVKGERASLDTMVATEEFNRIVTRAQVAVDHIGVVNCLLGEQLQSQMSTFLSDTADLR